MSTNTVIRNANDKYRQFNCTENYYRHWLPGIVFTDGVKQVAEDYGAFWFIDVIASYQGEKKFKQQNFQVWKLKRVKDDEFLVTAEDGNYKEIGRQRIPFSDFKDDELTFWKEDNVILLPSEH